MSVANHVSVGYTFLNFIHRQVFYSKYFLWFYFCFQRYRTSYNMIFECLWNWEQLEFHQWGDYSASSTSAWEFPRGTCSHVTLCRRRHQRQHSVKQKLVMHLRVSIDIHWDVQNYIQTSIGPSTPTFQISWKVKLCQCPSLIQHQ